MPPTTPTTLIRYPFEQPRISNSPHQSGSSILIPRGREELAADIIDPVYSPYLPPATLHPSIVAEPSATEQIAIEGPAPPLHVPPLSTSTIAIVLFVAFLSLLCSLVFIMSSRFKLGKTTSRIKRWIRKVYRGTEPKYMGGKITHMGETYSRYPQARDFYLQRQKEIGREAPQDSPTLAYGESQTIRVGVSTSTIRGFQKRLELEERDITLALDLALRDRSYSETEPSPMEQDLKRTPGPEDDHRASWQTITRLRQGSDASHSTQQTLESDIFSTSATTRSSLTSIREIHDGSDIEDEEMETEDTAFEVTRAQTQSMEIKKGVLVNWSTRRTSPHEDAEPLEKRLMESQLAAVPSLVVTCPSTTTLSAIGPSLSSVSVDLNDFPAPPVTW